MRIIDPEKIEDYDDYDDYDDDINIRPKSLSEFIGQTTLKENLEVFIKSSKLRKGILEHILLSGPPGLGKCLVKGSLLLTDNGFVKIEDLVKGKTDYFNEYRKNFIGQTELFEHFDESFGESVNFDNIKNIKNVMSMSPKLEYKPYKILDKFDMGISNVISVRTEIGFEITGTPEHKVVIINREGYLKFKKLENISNGDYVALTYNTNCFRDDIGNGGKDRLKLNYMYRKSYKDNSSINVDNISYMHENIARLLGYIVSEGNAGFNESGIANVFTITTHDKEMRDDIKKICNYLGIDASDHYDKRKEIVVGIRISSIIFADFMYYLGYRHLAQNKEIPWSILQADKNSQIAFLRALFDGDGYIGFDNDCPIIEYCSSSSELCRQLQIILLNMGMVGRLAEHKGATLEYRGEIRNYENSYRLTMFGEDIQKYSELIGFGLTRKQDILNECTMKLEETERWTDITIPFINYKLKELYDLLVIKGKMRGLVINDSGKTRFPRATDYLEYYGVDFWRYTINSEDKNARKPSRFMLEKILSVLEPLKGENTYRYLNILCESFIFDKVEDIKNGKENVYDIAIDDVHSYIANGMINHNTTIANILAKEAGVDIVSVTGPSIKKAEDIISILISLKRGDILFIDEIHGLSKVIEEILYPAMEDFRLTFTRSGVNINDKKVIKVKLKSFTLVGATTRIGSLAAPFRDRFGIVLRLDLYSTEELVEVIRRSSVKLGIPITNDAIGSIASRSRGTPRVANRLLRRVRDFNIVYWGSPVEINKKAAESALQRLHIDYMGLDDLDRKIIYNIYSLYGSGPVGVKTIAMSVDEEVKAIEDVYEPFLVHIGFLIRTPGGRKITSAAIEHLKNVAEIYSPSFKIRKEVRKTNEMTSMSSMTSTTSKEKEAKVEKVNEKGGTRCIRLLDDEDMM